MVVSYLQWLGELNEVSLHSLAGVDLRAQADHLAPQFQTLLVQSCLTNTEITVTWNPCLFDFNISQLKKKKEAPNGECWKWKQTTKRTTKLIDLKAGCNYFLTAEDLVGALHMRERHPEGFQFSAARQQLSLQLLPLSVDLLCLGLQTGKLHCTLKKIRIIKYKYKYLLI